MGVSSITDMLNAIDSGRAAGGQQIKEPLQTAPPERQSEIDDLLNSVDARRREVIPGSPADIGESIKSSATDAHRTALVLGGGITGSILGAPIAPPFGSMAGSALLATVGGQLADVIDEAMGWKEPPASLEEAFKTVGARLAGNVAAEVVFGAAGSAGPKTAKAVTKKMLRGKERIAAAVRQGVDLLPGEITEHPMLLWLEQMMGKSPTTASTLKKFNKKRVQQLMKLRENALEAVAGGGKPPVNIEKVGRSIQKEIDALLSVKQEGSLGTINKLRDNFVRLFGSTDTYEELGARTKEVLAARSKELNAAAQEIYADKVTRLLPDKIATATPVTPLIDTAKQIIGEEAMTLKAFRNSSLEASLKSVIKEAKDGVLPWGKVIDLRRKLNAKIAAGDASYALPGGAPHVDFMSSVDAGNAKRLKRAVDASIEMLSNNISGGELKEQFDLATSIVRQGKQFVKSGIVKKLLRESPEKIVPVIAKADLDSIKLLKKEMKPKDFGRIKDKVTDWLLGIKDYVDEDYTGKLTLKRVESANSAVLSEIYDAKELNAIVDVARKAVRKETSNVMNPFFKRLMAKEPRKVVESVIFPENMSNIRRAKAVVSEETWANMQTAWAEKALQLSPKDKLMPGAILKRLAGYDKKTLDAIGLPGGAQVFINDLHEISKLINTEQSGIEKFLALTQAGLQLYRPGVGTAVNVGSWLTAKIYLSKTGRRLMIKGLKAPAGSRQMLAVGAKMLAQMANEAGMVDRANRERR